jgi:radical SAM protein with 4Fe4S-binding SPASM domain
MSISGSQDFFVQWHLTERCNLRCKHCYQTGGKTEELSFAEVRGVVKEVSEMLKAWSDAYDIEFSPSFNITGGEPFLRKDILEIIAEIGNSGFEIYLLSNGTIIDGGRAKRLAALGVRGVQVSMEGPEEIHEGIRGKGSYASTCKGISHLLDAGLKVTLNATLSELNAEKFPEMVGLASSLGVPRLGFSRLVPSGRGAGLIGRMLKPERIKEIYEAIFSLDAGGLEIVTGDPVASQMSMPACEDDLGPVASGGCAAGISGFTLLPDGTIIPCRRLHIPLGNVREDSLREVWAGSEVLELLRDRSRYKGKCGRCRRWAQCRGCRAIAYAYSVSKGKGDVLAEDPQCFICD